MKVNDFNDSGQVSDWVAGMDWVYDNLATNKVKLMNLSIGTNALYRGDAAECDRARACAVAPRRTGALRRPWAGWLSSGCLGLLFALRRRTRRREGGCTPR